MTTISITGYEPETTCEHCGRQLKHGVRLSDGRVVGATCLDKKLTKAKNSGGRTYRLGAEKIVTIAKVVAWKDPSQWARYGVSHLSPVFESAE